MARAFTDCLGVAARAAPCLVFDRRRCEEEWLRLFRWPERLQIGSALRHGWPLAPPPRAHQSPGTAIIFDRSCCDKQWQWRHRLPELWCWGGWCFLPATAMDLLFPPSLPPRQWHCMSMSAVLCILFYFINYLLTPPPPFPPLCYFGLSLRLRSSVIAVISYTARM